MINLNSKIDKDVKFKNFIHFCFDTNKYKLFITRRNYWKDNDIFEISKEIILVYVE